MKTLTPTRLKRAIRSLTVSDDRLKGQKLVLGVTGSIAAYKAAHLASRLTSAGASVTVVMTANAKRFIAPLTFQTVTRNEVIDDLWGSAKSYDAEHVALAKSVSLVLVAPATANIIAKAAAGIADDALSCLLVTAKVPVLFAPAMNCDMYSSDSVQQNIATLTERGCRFVGPVEGRLADGTMGVGRFAKTDKIISAVAELLD